MTTRRPRLAFVSPVFLFPNDAGGKIRTTNILRGMRDGAFDVTLLSPATSDERARWTAELERVCTRFVGWTPKRAAPRWRRAAGLLNRLPVNVLADRTDAARTAVREALARERYDLVVYDFVHAAVLRPDDDASRALCFTHNVEAEIFARHAAQAKNAVMRAMWRSQHRKMTRFEGDALRAFDGVVAVSERDARHFREHYGLAHPYVIPTAVDLEFFSWCDPARRDAASPPTVVFTGTMDWGANVDGVLWFLDAIWPKVKARVRDARFFVVGRDPAPAVVDAAAGRPDVHVTGRVDDVRPFTRDADAVVIPLRVGGGTRIKAFEAMAIGGPVVSTAIGIEGLDVEPDVHYLLADGEDALADATVRLLSDAALRARLSRDARALVEARFGSAVAARAFEDACLRTVEGAGAARP